MKKLFLCVICCAASLFSSAQTSDFGLHFMVGATKKIDKRWSVGMKGELRSANDARTIEHASVAVEGQHKFTKWLKMSAAYKFISDRRDEKLNAMRNYRPSYMTPKHRVAVSLTGDVGYQRFKFSLRERWQYTYRPEKTVDRYDFSSADWEDDVVESKAENVLRSRFQVGYDIAKCKVDPYANIELFNAMALDRTRLTVGAEYKLTKQHVFELFYRFQYTNRQWPEEDKINHYIGFGYNYKF